MVSWRAVSFVWASLFATLAHADSVWTPVDFQAASLVALSQFQQDYGEELWKGITGYAVAQTKAGGVVRITYREGMRPDYSDYVCRYVEFRGEFRMDCHEH